MRYLESLAEINVIQKPERWDLSSPVSFLVKGISTFRAEGPLSKKVSELMLKQTFSKLEKDLKAGEASYSNPGLFLTNEQRDTYWRELGKLEEKYINVSIENRNKQMNNAHRVSVFITLIPRWEPELFSDVK